MTTDPETGDDRLVLINPDSNEEIGDYTAVRQARDEEAERARAAEAQVRELEAEIRRLRRQGTS